MSMPDRAAPVAAISGGTSGIGLATAGKLLRQGYRVAVFGHSAETVQQAETVLEAIASRDLLLALKADIRDPADIEHVFCEIERRLAAPSVFVGCAGISPKPAKGHPTLANMDRGSWDDVLSVNLTGAMLCCQAVLPGMQRNGFGRIILVGSVAGRTRPLIAGPGYAVTKAGLAGLSRSIVTHYAACGITSNIVAPGRILTPLTGPASSEANRAAMKRIPAGRLGTPDEVAAAIAFLVSPEAGFINGAILDINGGEFVPS